MKPIQYPVEAGGPATRVIEAGRGGLPVVMVHGMGARADRWRENIAGLAPAGFHCIALDLPGHGFARKGPGLAFDIPSLSAFLSGVLDAVGIGRCILMGTSLGGHICARLACDAPDRVATLVLVGSLGFHELPPESRQRMTQSLADNSEEGVRAKLSRLLFDQSLVTEDWIREECAINGSPGAAEAFAALAAHIRADDGLNAELCLTDLARHMAAIPTLLVWGEEERSVPVAFGRTAHKNLPGSEFHLIAKAGHLPYLEQAPSFHRTFLDFLVRRGADIRGRL
jgi:2-hydroxy-6-oxonona-2,4-dienedioate hydrolase